jgi:hypothetical protein
MKRNEIGRACSAYGGEERCAQGVVGKLIERDNWGDPDVDERIILRWTFKKWRGGGTGLSWLRIWTGGGYL